LESSYNTALLLSLRGVNTVVCHQFAVSAEVNAVEVSSLWDALYTSGTSVATAVQRWRRSSSSDVIASSGAGVIASSSSGTVGGAPKLEDKKRLGVRPAGSGAAAVAAIAAAAANNAPISSVSPPAIQRIVSASKIKTMSPTSGKLISTAGSGGPTDELIRSYDRFNSVIYGIASLTLS
jgi:hypothetical protein